MFSLEAGPLSLYGWLGLIVLSLGVALLRRREEEKTADEEPIRAELCSLERLEQYAIELAASYQLAKDHRHPTGLLERLEENGRLLTQAYRTIAGSVRQGRTISPAAEWLMDNFHIVQEQLREIREDLPGHYYRELPKLAGGPYAGYPRVYHIAVTILAHSDCRLDGDVLRRFMQAYQIVSPLTIGELWAVAIMLRLALVENLRRLAKQSLWARAERERADAWADRLLETAEQQPSEVFILVADRERSGEALSPPFAAQLLQRLRDQGPGIAPALLWLEQRFARQGTSGDEMIRIEHQRQAANQVSVGNVITSMRLLSSINWAEFVEHTSLVEQVLRDDPAETYALLDFETRNRYRTVIEKISKRSGVPEVEVARHADGYARESWEQSPQDEVRAHVGYYLIDQGRARLEAETRYWPDPVELARRAATSYPTFVYLSNILLITVAVMWVLLSYAHAHGASTTEMILITLLLLLPASDLAVSAINRDITFLMKPSVLPKLEFKDGIPRASRTMVAVPTLLVSEKNVRELLEHLEICYLANQEEHLHFALLTDFTDAPQEDLPQDEELLALASDGIRELNHRYCGGHEDLFFLFHRRRLWNESEGCWMGWERKRGKIEEFNRLLRGAADTSYTAQVGESRFLGEVRYVITLDADTGLPRDTAKRLIGTIAHPLNHARYDGRAGRVTEGYGILQPRVSMTLKSAGRSLFTRIFSGNSGVDPYTMAVSDVYQDLFSEGNYVGKGIYDVDAFNEALSGRIPENTVLSHDLLEGFYARTGLATDIELFDDYPSHYHAYAARQHRWVRGDWQIIGWLWAALPAISHWKIVDNLRRSLVAPSTVALLVAAWTVLPGSPLFWTLFALLVLAFPIYGHVGNMLIVHPRGVPWTSHLLNIWNDALLNTYQVALTIAFLPHQAYLMLDAIIRSLTRMTASKKKMLEWVTAAQVERTLDRGLDAFWGRMRPAPVFAVALLALIILGFPNRLPASCLFLTVWLVSPVIAYWVSKPLAARRIILSEGQQTELRRVARKTWRYFETFIGPQDHWLPPDNFQEDPKGAVAHRTSPTNISLYLLSSLSAYDFGYLNVLQLAEALERTFATLDRLERFRGHFYNWYDTESLQPLSPTYISTVDSGNLAGHLLALRQGCLEAVAQPLITPRMLDGMADALALFEQELGRVKTGGGRGEAGRKKGLEQQASALRQTLAARPDSLPAWVKLLDKLAAQATGLEQGAQQLAGAAAAEATFWAETIKRSVEGHRRFLEEIIPWVGMLPHFAWEGEHFQSQTEDLEFPAGVPSLAELTEWCLEAMDRLAGPGRRPQPGGLKGGGRQASSGRLDSLKAALAAGARGAAELAAEFHRIAELAGQISAEMDFSFLYDERRRLFAIGYSVADGRRDNSYYDLLASEARLASFIAIAGGQAPQQHWFHLGRPLTKTNNGHTLLSWTATMFEYLMPLLVMRNYEYTLLDQTYRNVVARQMEYGAQRGVPWGISESAYNARDLQLNYQYQAFGVPGLGLKRGLSDDLVISPYSTAIALSVRPHEAIKNLRRLAAEGLEGQYGFYEAVDYTTSRLPAEITKEESETTGRKPGGVIRAYMAHHQGMSLVAFDNLLNGNPMPRRFHAELLVQATELLLQERIPRNVPLVQPHAEEVSEGRPARFLQPPVTRRFPTAQTPVPQANLMSNGNYTVMVTNSGGGFSRWKSLQVTRWREDTTRDHWGAFCYVRDVRSGEFWATGYQPTALQPQSYSATFSIDKAEFHRLDVGIETHTEIAVSPEEDAEVRRITLTNRSGQTRELEVTSYAEIVLASASADAAHPAFSNLFVQSEFIPEHAALLFTRRPRASDEKLPWAVHVLAVQGETPGPVECETDRGRFIGRGRTPASPIVFADSRRLSGSTGTVLDPIASLRQRVRLEPGESCRLSFVTAVAETREAALALSDKYHDPRAAARTLALAWTHSQVELRHLNISAEDAHLFQRLASHALYANRSLRPPAEILQRNVKQQSGLWAYGISGDLPIILVRIAETEEAEIVRQLLHAHEYWRLNGLSIDLVILNEHPSSYAQGLQEYLLNLIRTSPAQGMMDKPGGVFLRRADLMPEEDRYLLFAVARAVLVGRRGSLSQQLSRRVWEAPLPPPLKVLSPEFQALNSSSTSNAPTAHSTPEVRSSELLFFNGLGGFSADGREYVMILEAGKATPAPWVNVIANPRFGFLVTESGGGYTWSENSRENRLTPWSNDPISDPAGEAIYLRDEQTGEFWSPTPHPIRLPDRYIVRHGQGYSLFSHHSHGLDQELLLFVPPDDPVKLFRLRVKNESGRRRRLSATSYAEWVLGVLRDASAPYVVTEVDMETGAILARNNYNNEFAHRVAFADAADLGRSLTASRTEFIGRNGTLGSPAALRRSNLSGQSGAGLDPCAALQVNFELAPGQEREIIFLLGEGDDLDHARTLIKRYRDPREVQDAFDAVRQQWDQTLGAIEVHTPDAAMDAVVNRWLLYQTLACRVWGRSAFYQSGGAYGFRDQLQDVMALVYSAPHLAREQILRAAGRQFIEGDVQHWWHPPTGRGVRTRCSDDLHWLPFVTRFYVNVTGDEKILDEAVPFLSGRLLEAHEDEYYGMPAMTDETASLYEHCVRALDRGLEVGAHGLPLMGSGDWNDGMNRVGHQGQGESVWLAWFLHATLTRFAEQAKLRGDGQRAELYRQHAERLRQGTEKEAWDGAWYRRAYFDDGTPLGSVTNDECRIDAIAQSWGVISGAAEPERARRAMASVVEHLERRDEGLILLFTPPFDHTSLDPGYIKGYAPGVRENGGQYTHASLWTLLAFAMLGDGDRAGELFALLNPINHTRTADDAARYKVEPYVVTADVYSVAPHTGRGGWTWYTGSAGWMYRIGIEALLGFKLRGQSFVIDPCIPSGWPKYEIIYRYHTTRYHITVENPQGLNRGVTAVELDGSLLPDRAVPLVDDRHSHTVRVIMGDLP